MGNFHPAMLCLLLLFFVGFAGSVNFNFPPQTDIRFYRDASFQRTPQDAIMLTRNITNLHPESYGCAAYDKPIPIWNNVSNAVANFTTHFQFVIGKANNNSSPGSGLAVFMAPFDFQPPSASSGWWLGLFNGSTDKAPSNQIVAVEFDTFKDHFDEDDNHIGIDINSIVSVDKIPLGKNSENQSLKNGLYWDAWVEYNGGTNWLEVYLLSNPSGNSNNISKPETPILGFNINLREILPENVRVGFSSSTGSSQLPTSESHKVYTWNFTSSEIPSSSPVQDVPSSKTGQNISSLSRTNAIFIALSVCLLAVCGFLFVLWYCYFKTRQNRCPRGRYVELEEQFAQRPRSFSYADLSTATHSFSENLKLGEGGFGGVYRGILPGTNEVVAVKRISHGSRQGKSEYVSEVTIISRLRHRNLIQLLGWCHESSELLLVYEFLPNGSLDKHLFDEEKEPLDWDQRYRISCDIASALVYLHDELDNCIVHRDVKTSNVILDSSLNAKLGDFGLARIVKHDGPASHTTSPRGTLGYLAPECAVAGKTSPESDVFSFGVVALEIACGRRPVDLRLSEHNCRVVEWVWDLYKQGKLLDAADKRLGGNFNEEEMQRLMVVGLLCCQQEPKARPEMRYVMKILRFDVELPSVPLYLYDTSKTFSPPLDPVSIGAASVSSSSNRNTSRSLRSMH
ncbi:L-type lectin-domain containing receptor kinase IX.1-like [Cryptomeria japonica]|uniref:L-type lectin-domain containing receptor kinase IX.1-like n=1 Tax=Cryptomeria japonica TaxID=3369 RepID=UPI0027D9FA4E|nr:L-type lectin-domain containing receptor kinase IX.1-like [Cryptomeria japonica]